jgi:hypothetical protein
MQYAIQPPGVKISNICPGGSLFPADACAVGDGGRDEKSWGYMCIR